ncbi:MAG: hypothetical protein K6F21_03030 [Bacteroidales bacterium]|nr:hypothetical protein [Bacteroidales bacterium]
MKETTDYRTPSVFRKIPMEMEGEILAGSVVDQVPGVKTTGQEKGDFFEDASSIGGSSFNHSWGD